MHLCTCCGSENQWSKNLQQTDGGMETDSKMTLPSFRGAIVCTVAGTHLSALGSANLRAGRCCSMDGQLAAQASVS